MKIDQYTRQEKAIAAADKGGIRERWLYGLRLLRDDEAMSLPDRISLRHGVAERLVGAATARGYVLSAREIRYRLQCARMYPTEAEIGTACSDFESWSDLRAAGFPAYEAPSDEPPADHRTKAERDHDRARALAELDDKQTALFLRTDFEPATTTLKELQEYAEEMADLTERFRRRDQERAAYLKSLIKAADDDLSMTWQEAQDRLNALDADAPDETDDDGSDAAA